MSAAPAAFAALLVIGAALAGGCSDGGGEGTPAEMQSAETGGGAASSPAERADASAEIAETAEMGGLTVVVTYAGEPPVAEPVTVDTDIEHCGGKVHREDLIVDPTSRGLSNVALRLEDVRGPRTLPEEITVTNRDCSFDPHVQVAVTGTKIVIENADPILHTTHPYINDRSLFNVPLRKVDEPYGPRPIREAGVMKITCDVHSWMRAWVVVHDNPYIAISDENGTLSIDEIPAGTYDWVSWHESLGEKRGTVAIRGGETSRLELSYGEKT